MSASGSVVRRPGIERPRTWTALAVNLATWCMYTVPCQIGSTSRLAGADVLCFWLRSISSSMSGGGESVGVVETSAGDPEGDGEGE